MGQKRGGLKHRIVHSEAKCDYHAPKNHNMLEKNEFLLTKVILKHTFDQSWFLAPWIIKKRQQLVKKGGLKHKTVNYEAKYDFQVPKSHSLVVTDLLSKRTRQKVFFSAQVEKIGL